MIDIDREHPDFRRQKLTWRSYRDLYAGGQQFKQRAADYLFAAAERAAGCLQ